MKGNPMKTRVEEVNEQCSMSLIAIFEDLRNLVRDVSRSRMDAVRWSIRFMEDLEKYVQYRIESNNLTKVK